MAKMECDQQTWINTFIAMKTVLDLSVAANGEVQHFSQTLWMIHWSGRDCSTRITSLLEVLRYLTDSFQLFLMSKELCKASESSHCGSYMEHSVNCCLSLLPVSFFCSGRFAAAWIKWIPFVSFQGWCSILPYILIDFSLCAFCSAAAHNSLL